MIKREIKFNRRRKFGVELEYNSPDNRVMARTFERLNEPVNVVSYQHIDNPTSWHCKTDSSCGYEVSSKVLSGPRDIKLMGTVLESLKQDGARFDNRCGQHVHIETVDFSAIQKQVLGMYWIKVENFVLNAEKAHRRNNTYCRKANEGARNLNPNQRYEPSEVWNCLGGRGAINFAPRLTTEFRFGSMTDNAEDLKNRVRFLIWFVDICKIMPPPPDLNWFTPKQVMRFLGLWSESKDQTQKIFSPAVTSMKKWILGQFKVNAPAEHYGRDISAVSEMITALDQEESKAKEVGSLELSEEFDGE